MTTGLVGSEMCIRDRLNPSTQTLTQPFHSLPHKHSTLAHTQPFHSLPHTQPSTQTLNPSTQTLNLPLPSTQTLNPSTQPFHTLNASIWPAHHYMTRPLHKQSRPVVSVWSVCCRRATRGVGCFVNSTCYKSQLTRQDERLVTRSVVSADGFNRSLAPIRLVRQHRRCPTSVFTFGRSSSLGRTSSADVRFQSCTGPTAEKRTG